MQAKANDTVRVHYTGRLTNGQIFDSSLHREPLEFIVGAGQMIPGFDAAVNGMGLNEKREVTIPCAQAYGDRDDMAIQQVPRIHLPQDMEPQVGQTLVATDETGHQIHVIVTEVNDQMVTLDANHPLAGEDLIFEIELVEIV
jgi:peptidylprolyl isomerase